MRVKKGQRGGEKERKEGKDGSKTRRWVVVRMEEKKK